MIYAVDFDGTLCKYIFERRKEMRKGQGELTYKQLMDENRKLRLENEKLKNELKSRTVAYNKLLKGENQ